MQAVFAIAVLLAIGAGFNWFRSMKRCPTCAKVISPNAKVCPYCRRDL